MTRTGDNASDELFALSHPLRIELLQLFATSEETLSPSMAAEKLGAPLGNVSYHVRILLKLGLVKLARKRQRRGAIEHLYRPTSRALAALGRATPPEGARVWLVVRDGNVDGLYAFLSEELAERYLAVLSEQGLDAYSCELPLNDAEGTAALVKAEQEDEETAVIA